ncbi:hypothetical protein EDB86DRAFT_171317 [Lactarius hatsudake]|nr:hypothetical protein EDB86DRAFT_171317 [Lactarius hatsudake]
MMSCSKYLIYRASHCTAYFIRHYWRFFHPPATSSPSNFTVHPQLVTIYSGRWLHSATVRNDRIRLPPVTRIVLPALTSFRFHGASEYLEDFISQIDAPQLQSISVDNIPQLVDYRATQLSKFIDRRSVTMYPHVKHPPSDWRHAEALVSLKWVDWPVMDIAQLLSHFPTTLSNVVHLNLVAYEADHCLEDIGDVDWLLLFRQFSTVQTLRLSPALAWNVALALEDIKGELVDEVLPSLDLVWIVGQRGPLIKKFIATRMLYGLPVTVVDTETEFNERLEFYVSR